MIYHYNTKAHLQHSVIKLLLETLCSALIVTALCVLVLWASDLPVTLMRDSFGVICTILVFPVFFIVDAIRSFLQQWAYESESELRIEPEQDVPMEMTIRKKGHYELYHISSITSVKKKWKGIAVSGKIAAEYIYNPEIGRHDTEELDHVLIPPYFGKGKSIVRELEKLAGGIPSIE